MTELQQLYEGVFLLLGALRDFGIVLVGILAAHCILLCWVVYWTWFARWPDLRPWLRQGAWVGVALLYMIVSLTWGLCTESPKWGFWPNISEKFFFAALWIGVAFGCGAIQDYMGWTPPEVEITGPPDAEPQPVNNSHK